MFFFAKYFTASKLYSFCNIYPPLEKQRMRHSTLVTSKHLWTMRVPLRSPLLTVLEHFSDRPPHLTLGLLRCCFAGFAIEVQSRPQVQEERFEDICVWILEDIYGPVYVCPKLRWGLSGDSHTCSDFCAFNANAIWFNIIGSTCLNYRLLGSSYNWIITAT